MYKIPVKKFTSNSQMPMTVLEFLLLQQIFNDNIHERNVSLCERF
jgi:hypothetical protein